MMQNVEEKPTRRFRLFGYECHGWLAVGFALWSVFALPRMIRMGEFRGFVAMVVFTWGVGTYFAMIAVMAESRMVRFFGLASFAVLEWSYLRLFAVADNLPHLEAPFGWG